MIQQEEAIFNTSVPDPGLLVEVRRRHWTVKDVDDREHGRDQKGQTLVTLESIDEDSLGEELQVLWQIEPGARVVPRVGLPKIDGYDRNEDLEAYLNAVRWGAIANAEQRASLQAPFRSGITIEDYQLDPLVRALDMSHVSLLIADDVGLGKTIEAGLVVQELLLRCRARTVFVVCPASLQIKWQEEMLSKFGLKFEIVDTEYLRKLRRERGLNVNPWTSYPRLITSMDWIKTGEGLRFLKETLPAQQTYPRKFDILVVDEAHNVAPAGYAADYSAKPSLRTQVIQRMTPHFTHKLFLSATPHNGYPASFTSLLELLDDQRFSRSIMPTEKQLQPVLVRRLKSDLYDEDHKPFFSSRELKALEIDYTPEEREICRKLRDFTDSLLENAQDSATRVSVKFVGSLLKKRLFSSSAAFANTLEKYRATLLAGPKKKRTKPDEGRLLRAVRRAEEDVREETEREEATEEALELTSQAAPSLDDDRLALLNDLCKRARQIAKRGDSKEQAIVDWLNRYLRINGKWNNERVVLFTEYLDTFKALYHRFTREGFGVEKTETGQTRKR
ncbi:MAG: DISARM system SNF2-like helicase DrmD, partial [Thermoguttaceae bacterium]|nr:DISARM system SNF2-like helicase DrmD [Thermoguttaceae bacterium]